MPKRSRQFDQVNLYFISQKAHVALSMEYASFFISSFKYFHFVQAVGYDQGV